jgi:hypothetical protein
MAFLKRGDELILGNGQSNHLGASHFGKVELSILVKYKFTAVDCVDK